MTQEEARAKLREIIDRETAERIAIQEAAKPLRDKCNAAEAELRARHHAELKELIEANRAALAPVEARLRDVTEAARKESEPYSQAAAGVKVGDRIVVQVTKAYGKDPSEREAVIVSVRSGKPHAAWITKAGKPSEGRDRPVLTYRGEARTPGNWRVIKESTDEAE